MTTPATITRNASIENLVEILKGQQPRKYDVVVPVSKLRSVNGVLVIQGAETVLDEDGVTIADGQYIPTSICDGGIADRLGQDLSAKYLATLRRKDIVMYDQNVNGWLRHADNTAKKFLVRCFKDAAGMGPGVARAFLSDSYKIIDHFDVLMTILDAIRSVDADVTVESADLTDRRMYVRVRCEGIAVNALELVRNYRSPYNGKSGADLPMMFAGLEFSNSEVGHGAFSIAPRVVLQVCNNGMKADVAAVRSQHLGGRLETEGEIVWSDETQKKNLELIRSKTIDAVTSFLSAEWLQKYLAKLEKDAGVEVAKPEETIKVVAQKMRYTEAQQDDILRMFIKGGDTTAGGVMHAVTASAQNQTDADIASDMEGDAEKVLALAAAHARTNR